jgi:hypothetical protein
MRSHPHQRVARSRSRAKRSHGLSLPSLRSFTRVRFQSSAPGGLPPIDLSFSDSSEFDFDISHWANSSSQVPVCSVEPGTPDDVAIIVNSAFLRIRFVALLTFQPIQLQQISRARVPFAVKGAGHATNPGFSSTSGVHISMTRFNGIVIREDRRTVEVGPGLTWTDVYKYLVPKGLNVVGGRLDGVGVAGLTLGGGECYSSSS